MWQSKGRSGYGDTNLDGAYDDVILGVSPNGRQYRNEATLEQRDLSGWAYWNLRKQNTPEQEIPEALYARNETEAMSHTLKNGQANLLKYADTIVVRKPTKVPLKNRILPQSARVEKLRSEAIELEAAFKAGEFTPGEYTLLRDVAFRKLRRAEELLKKAITPVRPTPHEGDEYAEEYPEVEAVYGVNSSVSPTIHTSTWIEDLPASNSLKIPLQKTLQVVRTLVKWHQKAKNYYITLKAL